MKVDGHRSADRRGPKPARRDRHGNVKAIVHFDKQDAFEEFKRIFRRNPDLVASITRRRPARVVPGGAPRRPSSPRRCKGEFKTAAGRRDGRRRRVRRSRGSSTSRTPCGWIFIVISLVLLGVVAVPDRQHDPPGDVRPPARDRGDEARRARRTGSCASRSSPRAWCRASWAPGLADRRGGSSLKHLGFDQAFDDRRQLLQRLLRHHGRRHLIAFVVLGIGVLIGMVGATVGLRRFLRI